MGPAVEIRWGQMWQAVEADRILVVSASRVALIERKSGHLFYHSMLILME
jgi:hypothetical protein